MTYNLYFKNRNSESSIKVIRNANPDILFVQELTSAWKAILEKSLGKQYPYHKTKPQEGTHGIGIYSKYPLKGSTLLVNRNKLPYAQLSEIKIKGKRIQLVNVHLASPAVAVENRDRFASLYWQNYKQRAKELNKISAIIHRDKGQFESQLLVGDLNTLFVEPIFQSLKKDWVNTYQKCGGGLGLNFPNSSRSKPIMTLDYIMARGKVNCIEASVLKGGNSDHLPILAELEL